MTLDLGIIITIGIWLVCDIAWKITTERRLARPQALEAENWALKQALGYSIPADKETINNPFKCGVCDARKNEMKNETAHFITHPVDDKGNVVSHPIALVSTNDTFERAAEEGKAS